MNCQVRVTCRMSGSSWVFGSGANGSDRLTMRSAALSSIGTWLDWMMRVLSTLPSRRTATLITTSPPPETRVVTSRNARQVLPTPQPRQEIEASVLPPGSEKIDRDIEMARLAAEIQLRSQQYAKRPKRKFVSASTKEYAWADYLRGWVDRVERVGNLNYPDEARRRRIGGLVVISVGVRRDGSVESIRIVQSSHVPMLDEAATRIVKLSQPFSPLPKTQEDPDVLHVTRTWQFLPGGELIDR